MISPYHSIFDRTGQSSQEDKRRIGLTTAALFFQRQEWLHRRVELVTFEDQDVMRRKNSIDFTLPQWAFDAVAPGQIDPTCIAVPIMLLRKGTLVHFNLSDEGDRAVPLLSGSQAGALAEMALLAVAELVLGTEQIPSAIVGDIHELACDRNQRCANKALERLFSEGESDPQLRTSLKANSVFAPLAKALTENYIGAVLLSIAGGDRRVIHFAYDEQRIDIGEGWKARREAIAEMLVGRRSHHVAIFASGAGDAASFHIEAEAPEGLQISSRETFFDVSNKDPDEKVGSFRRSHVHYTNLPPGVLLGVVLRISPRSSTIVRGAVFTSALTLLAVLWARLRLHNIVGAKAEDGAAVLLSIPALLSVYVGRADEHPATTHLLWPIRLVATTPGILGFAAASVVVGGGGHFWSKVTLWVIVALLTVATIVQSLTWHQAVQRQRRRSRSTD